ncbi:MAG: AAA family ATPase [Verrucomicrobia bacterium]|nr:AAA family ATPase [Verrucomicrobiota bacterium]
MIAQFKIKDADSRKEGTALASIRSPRDDAATTGQMTPRTGWRHAYIRIVSTRKTVGAIVEAVVPGSREVYVDPLLRAELEVAENGEVEIHPLPPVEAKQIEVAFPKSDLSDQELINLCRTYLGLQPVAQGQLKPLFLYSGERINVEIVKVAPADFCVLTSNTSLVISQQKASSGGIRFRDVGGLDHEKRVLLERVIRPLRCKNLFKSLGIRVPRGILISGPPGCGKTLLARALSGELGVHCLEVQGPEVFAGIYGETEKRIRELFAEARKSSPTLILVDEIDALAPSRQSTRGELERRVVTTLLAEMDGLEDAGDVIIVATTNEPDLLDIALRRPGRFDFEMAIGAPNRAQRLAILKIHSLHLPIEGVCLDDVAARTHGFSGADLMNLCREAAFNALRRELGDDITDELAQAKLRTIRVLPQDFEEALKAARPSALREFAVEVPTSLSWEDVGGLGNIKTTLVEEIVRAIADPEPFARMGIRLPRGVLLYGPPGTGKTLLARVIANRAGANFISVRGPEMLSKWFGESEQRIRALFERAHQVSPCIIFFDEIDAITGARGKSLSEAADRIVNTLLALMDGFHALSQVCVIAATNRKDILDPALLRPGRFDYVFEVPLPGAEERWQIFEIHLKDKPHADDIDLLTLAGDEKTKEFSGAHIAEVCRRAALEALREHGFQAEGTVLTHRHLLAAIELVRGNIENLEKKIRKIGFGTDTD